MKLSLYALMLCGTISTLSYGMHHEQSVSPVSLEELLAEIEAATADKSAKTAPVTVAQKKEYPKKANTLTSQEVCRLTLYAIAEKRLVGTKK